MFGAVESIMNKRFFNMKPKVKMTLIIVVGVVLVASMYFGYFDRLLDWGMCLGN